MFLPKRNQEESSAMAVPSSPPSSSSPPYNYAPNFQSPNAIPPRTSSTGQPSTTTTIPPLTPNKSVLRSVPESDSAIEAASRVQQPQGQAASHQRTRSRKASAASMMASHSSASFLATIAAQPTPPQPDPNRFATEDLSATVKRWSEEKENIVTGPFKYLYDHPGKDFRTQLISAFNAWLEVPPDSLEIINNVVGLLHTASLLVDDVEDNSQLRRGFPVAHTIFGVPQTINSSNYVYFYALQEVQKLKSPKVISIFVDELLNLHRGQGMDLFWRDNLICPSEDDYLEMVGNKTGGLFRLGIKLMQAESRNLVDCVPLVNIVGLIFQIADDYKNLSSSEYKENKGMCEDLTEGKFSFPVIHCIRSYPGDQQLLNILRQRPTAPEIKSYAVSHMDKAGSFEYTRTVVAILVERARKMADSLDGGGGRASGIFKILDKIRI